MMNCWIRRTAFFPKARINTEGIRTVLALRSRYSDAKKQLTDPTKYYDPTYYNAAMK